MCACEHVCVQACMCFFNQQQHVVSPRFPRQSVLVEDSGGRTLETAVMKCLMTVPRAGTHGRAGRREGGGLPLRASRGHRGSRKVGDDSCQTACSRSCSLHVLAVKTEPQNLSLTQGAQETGWGWVPPGVPLLPGAADRTQSEEATHLCRATSQAHCTGLS